MTRYLSAAAAIFSISVSAGAAFAQSAEKPTVTEPPIFTEFDSAKTSVCDGLSGSDFVLLQGDPKTGPTQWFFRLKAGTAFPKHWHSTPENMVTIRGALTFNFETGQTVTLKAGDHLHYQAGMTHWGQCEPDEDCLFFVFNDQPYDLHLAQ